MNRHIIAKGFTLVETIIYLALFSIVIGGALLSTAMLFESGGRDATKARLEAEGSFLLDKIAYQPEGMTNANSLQSLVDPSIVVTDPLFTFATSSNLGATITQVGVRFTLTTRSRQGRVVSEDFFATTTL